MAFHAKLSPSSSERWMNCAGSVNLIGDEPNTAGPPAWLGTAVHKVIETMVIAGETDARKYIKWRAYVHKPGKEETILTGAPEFPEFKVPADWQMFILDDQAIYGAQTMIDEIERVKGELFEPEIHSERFLNMAWLDSRLGGTADVTLVDLWIHLFDYKNGRVVVEVRGNEQMLNYGVGLLHEHPECKGVVVHLVQPNAVHDDGIIRVAKYSADEIKLFEIRLKEAALATAKPNAPLRAGPWCTYCPAKIRCPEFEKMVQEEAGADFANEPEDGQQLLPIRAEADGVGATEDKYRGMLASKAKWIPILDQWSRDIRRSIELELINGALVPGWKLVRGRANRKWALQGTEEDFIRELSSATEVGRELLYDMKIKSPAQVEKLGAGKEHKKFVKDAVARLTMKPLGKLSIAPSSDERDAIDPTTLANEDFAGEEEEFEI